VDIEIDGRYLRHANPTSERISDNARRRARNNRRVIQIEDAPPARLLMRFTYEASWKNAVPCSSHPFPLPTTVFPSRNLWGKDILPKSGIRRERTSCRDERRKMRDESLSKRHKIRILGIAGTIGTCDKMQR